MSEKKLSKQNGRICVICGSPLVDGQREYCSNKCTIKAHRRRNKIKEENSIKKEDKLSPEEELYLSIKKRIDEYIDKKINDKINKVLSESNIFEINPDAKKILEGMRKCYRELKNNSKNA